MNKLIILCAVIGFALPFLHGQEKTTKAPPELAKLKESWRKASEQLLAPVHKKYADALTSLKLRCTKEGRLEDAAAVDEELKLLAISQSASGSLTDEMVAGVWHYKAETENYESDLRLDPDGTALYVTTNLKGLWALKGRALKILWSNNRIYEFVLPEPLDNKLVKGMDGNEAITIQRR